MNNNGAKVYRWQTILLLMLALPLAVITTRLLANGQLPASVRLVADLVGTIILPGIGLWRVHSWLSTQTFVPLVRRLYWTAAWLCAGLVVIELGALGLHTADALPTTLPVVISLPILLVFVICTLHLAQHVNARGQIERKQWLAIGIFAGVSFLALGAIIIVVS